MRSVLSFAAAFAFAAPASAAADFAHTVAPGESLTSVAAADGLTVAQLAAANGISPFTQLVAGMTLMIPPQSGSAATPVSTAAPVSTTATASPGGGSYVVQPGDTLSAIAARAGVSIDALAAANGLDPNGVLLSGSTLTLSGSSGATAEPVSTTVRSASTGGGSYVVQPGDTLSAIAARAGVSVDALAAANGLDPNGVLLSGSALTLSDATATPVSTTVQSSAASQPIGAPAEGTPGAPPYPTPETVSSSEVASIAASDGVSPSLADAIGWQESGFNNDLVSNDGAVGVMQILPGTWDWIQRTLTAGTALSPSSATDNVRGGVLMLHALLNSTGGDPALAAAGFYQGLASVQQNGMYADTQQYVNDVMALRQRFGGP